MQDREKDGLGLPPISSVVIILVVIGAVLFNIQRLKSSRPTVTGTSEYMRNIEDVRTRLWQDPFDAVYEHEENGFSHNGIHSHYILAKKIADKVENGDKRVCIIGVMVEGGHYFENVEQKRRRRYAVVSALNVSGYKPEDAQKIGYFLTAEHKFKKEYNFELPERIPYELFQDKDEDEDKSSKDKPLIVLLWLDEEVFGNGFFSKINALTEVLHFNDLPENRLNQIELKILGPASSTTLKSMVKELRKSAQITEDGIASNTSLCKEEEFDNLKKIKFNMLSPIATVDSKLLVKGNKDIGGLFAENFPEGKFFRTIKSDYELGKYIYDELELRGVKPEDDHIVLISEWDTDYGGWIQSSLKRAFKDKNDKCDGKTIIEYSYIRGLDGQVSDDLSSVPSSMLQLIKDNNNTGRGYNASRGYANPSEGNGQFDYLQRMGEIMQNRNSKLKKDGEGRIKAIGVLGSDEYDKLLVLQALRKKFPEVIFFTTDLDTRFLDSDEIKWTRNLIVASNFGLRLHSGLQNAIPPFRDNYQTSVYLSTLMILNADLENYKNYFGSRIREQIVINNILQLNSILDLKETILPFKKEYKDSVYFRTLLALNANVGPYVNVDPYVDIFTQEEIYNLIKPKIFEIGRHNPCELHQVNELSTNGRNTNAILNKLKESLGNPSSYQGNSIYPDSPKFIPEEKRVYLLVYSFIFGAILFVTMAFMENRKILYWVLFAGYIVIIILFYFSDKQLVDDGYWLEPFTLFEGISIWPSAFLRFISFICSGLCLCFGYKRLKDNIEELGRKYFD